MARLDRDQAFERISPTVISAPVPNCAVCPLGRSSACRFKPRCVPAGATLWVQDGAPPPPTFLKSGLVGLSITDVEGRQLYAGVRGPGAVMGLEGLLGRPSHEGAIALSKVTICQVPPQSPPAPATADETKTLLLLAVEALARTHTDTLWRAGPALTRVARFLTACTHLIGHGRRAPFSKRHAAELIGLRPETLSRCLARLADDGVITGGESLRIANPAALARLADGNWST